MPVEPVMRVPVTVVIPTLNEADQIAECVRDAHWAAEVIVADAGSSDDTTVRARAAGATVLERTGPTIAAQRNAAIARAGNSWVFALDADERAGAGLASAIAAAVADPRYPAYQVRRRNFYLGRELTRGHWGRDWVTRLFPRERRYLERRVHERLDLGTPAPEPGRLPTHLLHVPYRTLSHQLEKMDRYARWGAEDLFDRGRRASGWDLAARPLGRFTRAYLLQGAVLDGRAGLVAAALGAYTGFLKYAHLWALERDRGGGGGGGGPA